MKNLIKINPATAVLLGSKPVEVLEVTDTHITLGSIVDVNVIKLEIVYGSTVDAKSIMVHKDIKAQELDFITFKEDGSASSYSVSPVEIASGVEDSIKSTPPLDRSGNLS